MAREQEDNAVLYSVCNGLTTLSLILRFSCGCQWWKGPSWIDDLSSSKPALYCCKCKRRQVNPLCNTGVLLLRPRWKTSALRFADTQVLAWVSASFLGLVPSVPNLPKQLTESLSTPSFRMQISLRTGVSLLL